MSITLVSFIGHKWKQGMWSKEEIDILMNNIERYLKVSYGIFFFVSVLICSLPIADIPKEHIYT